MNIFVPLQLYTSHTGFRLDRSCRDRASRLVYPCEHSTARTLARLHGTQGEYGDDQSVTHSQKNDGQVPQKMRKKRKGTSKLMQLSQ